VKVDVAEVTQQVKEIVEDLKAWEAKQATEF